MTYAERIKLIRTLIAVQSYIRTSVEETPPWITKEIEECVDMLCKQELTPNKASCSTI